MQLKNALWKPAELRVLIKLRDFYVKIAGFSWGTLPLHQDRALVFTKDNFTVARFRVLRHQKTDVAFHTEKTGGRQS